MSSKVLKASILVICMLVACSLSACYGGTATIADLPNPADDDRPPGSPPELPRLEVELPPAQVTAGVIVVSNGDDLQRAINQAKAGDVIALAPGIVVHGAVTLPEKSGSGWITIRTNAPSFVAAGNRVSPSDAGRMPVIESDDDCAIRTQGAAHHYQFIGIEIRPKSGVFVYNLVQLGEGAKSVDALPHHIVFDRCYIHADATVGGRRGIALNARHVAVLNSYLAGFRETGQDSEALCSWNGAGPFAILNNYLEAAGENVMFGGADPDIVNVVPSDIVIRNNSIAKALVWRNSSWTVKNLFELKNARRVLIEQNVFENNWPGAQNGYAILFTPRNQDGGSPWSMVRDVTLRNNIIRHVSSAVNILGTDDIHTSLQTKRILIKDNLFDDVSDVHWGGLGNLIQVLQGAADITVDHNTAFESNAVLAASGEPNPGFAFTNNIVLKGKSGVGGDNYYGNPSRALSAYFPGAVFLKNVIAGAEASDYPSGNFFPASMMEIRFVDYSAGNYRLEPNSPYKDSGTDRRDIGADIDGIYASPRRRAVH
jgi:hypothetical protein